MACVCGRKAIDHAPGRTARGWRCSLRARPAEWQRSAARSRTGEANESQNGSRDAQQRHHRGPTAARARAQAWFTRLRAAARRGGRDAAPERAARAQPSSRKAAARRGGARLIEDVDAGRDATGVGHVLVHVVIINREVLRHAHLLQAPIRQRYAAERRAPAGARTCVALVENDSLSGKKSVPAEAAETQVGASGAAEAPRGATTAASARHSAAASARRRSTAIGPGRAARTDQLLLTWRVVASTCGDVTTCKLPQPLSEMRWGPYDDESDAVQGARCRMRRVARASRAYASASLDGRFAAQLGD